MNATSTVRGLGLSVDVGHEDVDHQAIALAKQNGCRAKAGVGTSSARVTFTELFLR